MAVLLSMSPDWVRPFSCIMASSCSRSTTRNLPLLNSSVTNTSCAAWAPPWYHHWLSALFLNSRTAMRGFSADAALDRVGTATMASRTTPQRARMEARFMVKTSFRKIRLPLVYPGSPFRGYPLPAGAAGGSRSAVQLLRIDHAEGRQVHDVAHLDAALQDVDGLGHAEQDGADGL